MDERDPLQALLALVEADRDGRVRAIETESRESTRRLLAQARRAALGQVRAAIAPERTRLREGLASLDARLATERRLDDQRRLRERLDEAWRAMPAALGRRWDDPAQRARWTGHVRRTAAAALGSGPWSVRHAPGWPAAERDDFVQALAALGVGPVAVEEDPGLSAGLVVRAGGNVVDGSSSGLLADREATDASLAAALGLGKAAP